MRFPNLFIKLAISSILLTSACSTRMGTGGVFGTLVGIGTGALVGTVISRGDVVASAILGGAIGLPIGLAIGYHLQQTEEQAGEKNKVNQYMHNQRGIVEREREIESLREDVMKDSPDGEPDDADAIYIYKGTTLGNPAR
jgi:hypothetical protein